MFNFKEFLEKLEPPIETVRLLRHDQRGVAHWQRGPGAFASFASFQKQNPSPYAGATIASHFIPGPTLPDGSATALFLGSTRILDQWSWDGTRLPAFHDEQVLQGEHGKPDLDAFDLEWIEEGQEFSERILIRWGAPSSTRAWSQWSHRQPKEILEIRLTAHEPPFPGFSGFMRRLSEIAYLPQSWQAALASVGGVYLLVTDDGRQYVGSATGQDGFMARWRDYIANGHGGNLLLKQHGHRDYSVSILEVASPDMSWMEILAREAFWKTKLGAKAHGLNAN